METMDYWRLSDEFTVVQAALLFIGQNPSYYEYLVRSSEQDRPENFTAIFTALSHAIRGKRLNATVRYDESIGDEEIDWDRTTVLLEDLRDWLKSRGVKTGFFFPQVDDSPDYLDVGHENYAPKLAAAIKAWQAVNESPELLARKTVKQALEKWLRKNAGQYGLTKDDGNPNEQGINEIAKISN